MLNSKSPVLRYSGNPILSSEDLSFPSNLVFNAGVVKLKDQYVMAFRNDYNYPRSMFDDWKAGKGELRPPSCCIGLAYSNDGIHWQPCDSPIFTVEMAKELTGEDILHVYDPRLSVIDDVVYMAFATNTASEECRCGLVATTDFKNFELVTYTLPNNRNMLLFPKKIGDFYYRLERPFSGESGDIWISRSSDLRFWGEHKRLLDRKTLSFCNSKIGPGAPPVWTKHGWLTLFHTVTEVPEKLYGWETQADWHCKYTFGLMLLDLDDPSKVIGVYDKALLEPEMPYELEGFRGSVLFPGAMIPENDGSVKIYYGAADTVECLATGNLEELIALCKPVNAEMSMCLQA